MKLTVVIESTARGGSRREFKGLGGDLKKSAVEALVDEVFTLFDRSKVGEAGSVTLRVEPASESG